MSNNWTREHDRIIAERCEGLGVERWSDVMARKEAVNWMTHPDDYCFFDPQFKCYRAVDAYNTDIAAEKRAAEGWRVQKPGRQYQLVSAREGYFPVDRAPQATLFDDPIDRQYHATTLHEALYEAVTR